MISSFLAIAGAPFLLANFLLFGCALGHDQKAESGDVRQSRIGQEFTIKLGQQLKIEGEDFQVKFVGVSEDSRCPTGVNCIWAGNAAVALDLIESKCTTTLTLNTHERSQTSEEGKVGRYRVKLVKLDPYPNSERKIASSDYTATLLVSKE